MVCVSKITEPTTLPAFSNSRWHSNAYQYLCLVRSRLCSEPQRIFSALLFAVFCLVVPTTNEAAALNGSGVTAPSTVNLTSEGTADWSHWGLSSASSFNHKAGVTSQIGNITPLGAAPGRFGGNPSFWTTHSWTDGTPTSSQTGFPGGIFFLGVGNGYEISVPADTTVRTLRLYAGGFKSSSRVEASLSDGSAPAYSTVLSNSSGVIEQVITLTFSAASAGQTLTVRHTLEDDNGGTGNIGLQAATLQQASGGNQPPTFNALGNQSVTEGNTLAFTVTASDPDGPAPLVLGISASSPALPAAASFVDNGNGTGSFSWTPGSADVDVYSVTFAASDDGGAGLVTEKTITVTVNAAGGGALNGSGVTAPSTVNLTSEGTADWSHWGLSSASSFNHKAGVTSQIGNITPLGAAPGRFGGNPSFWTTHSWTDGTPTSSQTGFPGGIFFLGVGNGYEISVPADTTVRTLRLYAGGFKSSSRVEASLSDGSAPAYSTVLSNSSGVIEQVITLTFSAASAGQTLTVRHTLEDDNGGTGNIGLQAATLQQASGGNQPPTFNALGNQSVTEGNTLAFTVTASDPDGPAPLVLGISASSPALPAAASFVDNGNGTGSFSWTPGSADVDVYSVTFAASDDGGAGLVTEKTITVTVNAAGGGALNGSGVTAPSTVNLTSEGTADWSHWGLSSASSFNHKAGVTSQIGNITPLGAAPGRFGGNPSFWTTHSWTDGTPTSSQTGFPGGIFFLGVGNGYEISVPADTTVRTLRLYAGGFKSSSRVEASLSDGSAPAYSTVLSNSSGVIEQVITLTFSAASAGQTLTVRHTLEDDNGGTGNIGLQAATLQQASGGNQPPTFNALGNQSVTEGNTLAFTVTASDPDGPAPLVLGISASSPALPAAASFVDNGNGTGSFSWTPGSADVDVYSVTFAASDDGGAGLVTEKTITVTVNAAGGGALNGSGVTAPSTVNLTSEGTADWSHWGLSSASSFNHKAGVTSQIGNITPLGAAPGRFGGNPSFWTTHSWTDGTPTSSQTGFPGGIFFLGVGNGYEISVPADTTVRTLRLYAGGFKSSSRVEASLSDGSAPAYSTVLSNSSGVIEQVITLTFSAASAGQTLTVRHTLEDDNGGTGNIGLQAATLQQALAPLALPYSNDFSGTSAFNGWTVVNQTDKPSLWSVASGKLLQSNRVESRQAFQLSYHLGTYAYLTSGQALTNYRFSVDARNLGTAIADDIGVMFRYQDSGNYYRLTLNSRYGFTRLEKQVGGEFTALATNTIGYPAGEWLHFEIEVSGPSIKVMVNDDPLFAVTDNSLGSGTVALYCQEKSNFDNVLVDSVSASPSIVIEAPLANTVITGTALQVTAQVSNIPSGGYVDFLLDDSTVLTDDTAPFAKTFLAPGAGNHKVEAILRNSMDVEIARDTNNNVATSGENMVAIGDSITNGEDDNFAGDNMASYYNLTEYGRPATIPLPPGRILAFQGYEAVLTDWLNTSEPYPDNIVVNEGIGGDETYDAAFVRIESILARHPDLNKTLIMLGTNDASNSIPSGAGCSGSSCNGTFKGNLQILVDKIRWLDYPKNKVPSNIMPIVALPPPAWNSPTPWTSSTNNRLRAYNTVVSTEINGIQVGPDFFDYFMPSATTNLSSLFSDIFHPNGLGYVVMASLWHNFLNPASPVPLPFVLNGLAFSTGIAPQQNLIENGDMYYLDRSYTLSNIPALLDGGRWIMPENYDKNNTDANYLSFNTDRPVNVYIAYDGGATALPDWMSGFTDAGETISTNDPASPILRLYVRSYTTAGAITLGGNLQGSAAGADSNYVAIVVEQ